MHRNKLKTTVIALLTISIYFFIGCSDYEAKDYEVSGIDAMVNKIIKDTVFTTVKTAILIEKPNEIQLLFSNNSKVIIDSLKANLILSSLIDSSAIVTQGPVNYYYERMDSGLIALDSKNDGKTFFYFGECVEIDVIDEFGDTLIIEDESMPLELVSDCYEVNDDGKAYPIIMKRHVYNLESKQYILKIKSIKGGYCPNYFRHFVIINE